MSAAMLKRDQECPAYQAREPVTQRTFILGELDILIAQIDHRVKWPKDRRRLYNAVVRIYERTDLETYRGSVEALVLEELRK